MTSKLSCSGMVVERLHPFQELARLTKLIRDERQRLAVVTLRHDLAGNTPEPYELLVVCRELTVPIHHQDAVGGGFERCPEQRERVHQIHLSPRCRA